jgi:hypothetical protein
VTAIALSISSGAATPAEISAGPGAPGASGSQTFALALAAAQRPVMPPKSSGGATTAQTGLSSEGEEIATSTNGTTAGANSQPRKLANAVPSMPFSLANGGLTITTPLVIPQPRPTTVLVHNVPDQPLPQRYAVAQFAAPTIVEEPSGEDRSSQADSSARNAIQPNLPITSQTQTPEIRPGELPAFEQVNSSNNSTDGHTLISATTAQSFAGSVSSGNASALPHPVSPQTPNVALTSLPSESQNTFALPPVAAQADATPTPQFGARFQSVRTSDSGASVSPKVATALSYPDAAPSQANPAQTTLIGSAVLQPTDPESVPGTDATSQLPEKTALGADKEGGQVPLSSVSNLAQNIVTAKMAASAPAASAASTTTQPAHAAAAAQSSAAPGSQSSSSHLIAVAESGTSKESVVSSQTPFSVFFSDSAGATESAASTLPKMILPPATASIPMNHSSAVITPNANAQAPSGQQGIKPAAAPPNQKESSAGGDPSGSPNPQAPHTNADVNAAVEVLAPQSSTAPIPVAAASTGATVVANAPVPANSNALPQPPATASSSATSPAPPPALPEPVPIGPVQAAQIVNRLGQSEMRVGLTTAAFGGVEVRTVIHTSDVGVIIGSEKGDLHALLANDLPAITNTLQQQNLRLNSVSFTQGFASSNNAPGDGSSQSHSFAPPRATADMASSESAGEDSTDIPAYAGWSGGGSLSILA